jgi:tetratricopeptide (TPR) repeat protein
MATVYLGQDLQHRRPVAIKVLHAELANALGPERFLREIGIAAQLRHPHILPLYDSGEAGGLLYYVMPYVPGESLRNRLSREKQLPLDDVLQITSQIASALAHAHEQGVVHRDIKPENILLEGHQAVLADFGIARALSAAGGERLTETGLALGTPAYMSPEQAAGERHLDGRSDIYSLGCVVYEMLAGEPPFSGPTAQAIIAKRFGGTVPRVRVVREAIPEAIDATIARALAKAPADRFKTVAKFSQSLAEGATATGRPFRLLDRIAPHRFPRLAVSASLALVAFVVLGILTFRRHRAPAVAVDPSLVAILPFRVADSDSALGYLREGMLDLLAVKLTGDGGPRAVDPRAVLNRLRQVGPTPADEVPPEAAAEVAVGLGAGRLVDGSVVGTSSHLILTASVIAVPEGRTRGRASVAGPVDSLPVLVDRLTAQLLAGEAGRIELATLTPLPALRAFLDGRAHLRAGRFQSAFGDFARSLQLDSGFALAAMGLNEASGWGGGQDEGRGLRLAWAQRHQLSPADRALLQARAGPRFPGVSPLAEHLAAAEQAVAAAPERPESWYELGDRYFHWGAYIGVDAPLKKAATAFRRALALDSLAVKGAPYAEPLQHLFELAADEEDTATVRRLGSMALAADSGNEHAGFIRWRMARVFRDTTALARLREQFEEMHRTSLQTIAWYTAGSGLWLKDGDLALEALVRGAASDFERWVALVSVNLSAMNTGQPRRALAALNQMTPAQRADGENYDSRYLVDAALFWDGDTSAGQAAFARLAKRADGRRMTDGKHRHSQDLDICWVQHWRLVHGELGTTPAAIARLREPVPPGTPDSASVAFDANGCAILLEAWWAWATEQPNAGQLARRLDSLLRAAPDWLEFANLVNARLLEASGDVRSALAAVRRRRHGWPKYLSTYLREEGRLAALAGDTAGAITAYQNYLRLRSDPEPELKPQAERVREELTVLIREPR